MKVAFLGFISAKEEYTDKKTLEVVRSVSVASTNQMLKIRLTPDQDFEEMDSVLVAGDIKVSDRNFYVIDPVIRLSTAEDRAFMAGKPVAAPTVGTPADLARAAAHSGKGQEKAA